MFLSGIANKLANIMGQGNTKPYKFALKHVFKNVSGMEEGKNYYGDTEEHFGLPWYISIKHIKNTLSLYFHSEFLESRTEWSIDAEFEGRVLRPNGESICLTTSFCFKKAIGAGWHEFLIWQEMEEEYLVNDELIVEVRVRIIKTTGIYKKNLRNFNDEKCSDVILVVNENKFHVLKLYLSTHSSSFRTKFVDGLSLRDIKKLLGIIQEESKKPEIKLSDVDADDLQKYLEALYGEDVIDEMTVEGILLLADRYDTSILVQKCEKFLLESSEKTLKKKLEMAVRYKLYALKKKCLNEIKTIEDIRSIVPGRIRLLDPPLMAVLFEKTLALKTSLSATAYKLADIMGQGNTKPYKFALKHVFKNVSGMEKGKQYRGDTEEYFSVPWYISIKLKEDCLYAFFHCCGPKHEKEFSIDTEYEICVLHPNGKSVCETLSSRYEKATGWGREFMTWQEMEKEYLVNDELIVEVRVKRMKTTGIYGENLRNFDDKQCSDVTLIVDERRFHVAKLYLSTHSSLFRVQFLGGIGESKNPEIKLSDVDADDLQKYLEALYGEDVIDELTVEGILLVADMYGTDLLVKKCEKFLLESSKKTLKKKLEMAVRYNLYALRKKCLNEIKTIEDIRSVVPGCISQMDPSIITFLFEKTLALK